MSNKNPNVWIRGNQKNPDGVFRALKRYCPNNTSAYLFQDKAIYYIYNNVIVREATGTPLYELITTHPDWTELFPEPVFKYQDNSVAWMYSPEDKVTPIEIRILNTLNKGGEAWYLVQGYLEPIPEYKIIGSVKTFNDLVENKYTLNGYYINDGSEIVEESNLPAAPGNRNLGISLKVCKSALATTMISQLIPYYGGEVLDGEPYWTLTPVLENGMWTIYVERVDPETRRGGILRFISQEKAEEFKTYNLSLVSDYFML